MKEDACTIPAAEDARTEFKSRFSMPAIEALVAFVNAKGGRVFVGVNDDGIPVPGFALGKETVASWVNEIKSKTQPSLIPDVELTNVGDMVVVCLSVPEYPVKPVSCRGKYFKRVGNSNHQLSLNEIADLHLQTINLSWDFTTDPHHGIWHQTGSTNSRSGGSAGACVRSVLRVLQSDTISRRTRDKWRSNWRSNWRSKSGASVHRAAPRDAKCRSGGGIGSLPPHR